MPAKYAASMVRPRSETERNIGESREICAMCPSLSLPTEMMGVIAKIIGKISGAKGCDGEENFEKNKINSKYGQNYAYPSA